MDYEQTSMFDDISEKEECSDKAGGIKVAELQFIKGFTTSWRELFSGFDAIYAITYSSSIGFIGELIELFEYAEIVFGCEKVMSYHLNEVMAFQTALMERLRSSKIKDKLIERINNDSLHLLVTQKETSHEKIYLLSAKDGRRRVITGSANMSYQGFSGKQRENISYIDGDDAYEWYKSIYDSLTEDCTDDITEKAILVSDDCENIDELPVSNTVRTKKILEISPDEANIEEIEFALKIDSLSKKYKTIMPKADKKGKVMLEPQRVTTLKKMARQNAETEKEKQKKYPQLVVSIERKNAILNEKTLDLEPKTEAIHNDVTCFLQYMNGYESFHGDHEYMQKRYYEFANWFFCSPFMAVMRDTAIRYNLSQLPYPVFGLLCGHSKAGKTSFLKTLLKMMIGQMPIINGSLFTRGYVDQLRSEVKGAPIIVDDLTQTRFSQHAIETIKNEMFGYYDGNVNYPAVVISANEDVKAFGQEISRRVIICRGQASLTNTEVMRNNLAKKIQSKIGTAFFREYLRRMLEKVPDMIELMKDEKTEESPDILRLSSEIIKEIIEEHTDSVPKYVRIITMVDYFSEKVTGFNAIQIIEDAWRTSRSSFRINKRANELIYDTGNYHEAARLIKELPENLMAKTVRDQIIMDLCEAKKFFEIDFKKSFFDRFGN